MGRDKALLPYGNSTLAGYIAERIQAVAGSAVLVGDPERYGSLGFSVIPDFRPGGGPLAGLETALRCTHARWNLVTACDMPGLKPGFLAALFAQAESGGALCTAPAGPGGRPEPLCAVWRRDALPLVEAALARGVRKMSEALEIAGVDCWRVEEAAWFENLNTPQEWTGHLEASR